MKIGLLLITVVFVSGAPHSARNLNSLTQLQHRITAIEIEFPELKRDLNRSLMEMKRHLEDEGGGTPLDPSLKKCQGFVDNGRCFTVVIIGVGGLNYYDAKRTCSYDGSSRLGNIYTRSQFDKLKDHVLGRKAETSLPFINVWTDMTRQIPSGVMRLSTGESPSYNGYGNWRGVTEWRTDESRRTKIYVSFWTDGQSHSTNPGGYGNVWPTFAWNAALCERVIR